MLHLSLCSCLSDNCLPTICLWWAIYTDMQKDLFKTNKIWGKIILPKKVRKLRQT